MTRKIGLDIIRSGAITLVLVSHFAKGLDFLGIYGVELFFALSGFLIGGILYRRLIECETWSFSEVKLFWLRRWWRTAPNYFLFLALAFPFHAYFGGLPSFHEALPFFVFSQDLLRVNSGFYGVSWSLCIEELFYLLFPICILWFTRLRCSKRNAFLLTTLLFLTIPPLLREFLFLTHDPAEVRRMTLPRLDAIFYGVAMSFLVARFPKVIACGKWLLVAAFGGLAGLFIFQYHCQYRQELTPFYRAALLGLPICFSLTLPCFASIRNLPPALAFLRRPVTNLSLWSYSIYLSHMPILWVVYELFGTTRDSAVINLLSKLVGLGACLLASRLIYTHFESKVMRLRPSEHPLPQADSRTPTLFQPALFE